MAKLTRSMLVAECFGTFALVFAGTGAIVINDVTNGTVTHVGVALTFGLIVMAMIYALGDISGAHLNPAVTLALWVAGRFQGALVAPFVASQFAGAMLASGALRLLFPEHTSLGGTSPAGSHVQAFTLEFILTLILMGVILTATVGSREKQAFAGIAVGGVIALEAAFAGPITGASMNPIRSLAPAIVSGQLETVWIYLAAPILGACAAVPLCGILLSDNRGESVKAGDGNTRVE